jgi:Recombination endonuclease VII
MSDWNDLPQGFLRLGFNRWLRFEPLRDLIVKQARKQNFRCALCSTDRRLIVEHDHDPHIGEWERPTIYNTRGLVCERCNRHIDFYEQRERGDYGWHHVNICFSDSEYDDYIYAYEMRVLALWENDLQKRLGHRYWRRRIFVDKFYDWYEGRWYEYPWKSYFNEIRILRRWTQHPEELFKTLLACMKFVAAEIEKNPNYQPPSDFIKVMFRIKPIIDELRPIAEAQTRQRELLQADLPA